VSEKHSDFEGPQYAIASASVNLARNRGLKFYAVSLFNPLHRDANLYASMKAIVSVLQAEAEIPNFAVHITDAIYAFNFMIDNPRLSYDEAKALAREAGNEWANAHMTQVINLLDFQPVVFNWSHWQDKRNEEYTAVLVQLQDLQSSTNETFRAFRIAADADVERFVSLSINRRQLKAIETDSTERERIRSLCMQFVLHEAAGYTLIGRHIVDDYMRIVRDTQPRLAAIIESDGGLTDGAFRLYPGGQLKCIEWLQRNGKKLPESLRGAEGISPVKIHLTHSPASNEDVFKNPRIIFVSQQFREQTKPQQ
jgi:hypothetical protein